MPPASYAELTKRFLVEELGDEYKCDEELVALYALLVLTRGPLCTLEDVHDAWSVWTVDTRPDHQSLVRFGDLPEEVQAYDEPYRDAIVRTAIRLREEG